jgi:ketosteroid isomerase-like protein
MPQAASPGLTAEDVKAIRKNIDDFVRFMLARDFDTLARRYAEDAVMMPPNHAAVRGREAIRQYLSASYPVAQFKSEIERIDGRADLAYVCGSSEITLHPDGAPAPVQESAKFVEIHKRQPDGSWSIILDIFNSGT